jgi:hypothetical protein
MYAEIRMDGQQTPTTPTSASGDSSEKKKVHFVHLFIQKSWIVMELTHMVFLKYRKRRENTNIPRMQKVLRRKRKRKRFVITFFFFPS